MVINDEIGVSEVETGGRMAGRLCAAPPLDKVRLHRTVRQVPLPHQP